MTSRSWRLSLIALVWTGVLILAALSLAQGNLALVNAPVEAMAAASAPRPDGPAAGRNYLNGVYADPYDTTTPALLGAPWDYTINNSYQPDCRGCSAAGLAGLDRYPVIIDLNHIQSSYPDFVIAAASGYDDDYRRMAIKLKPYAGQIYAARIDSEFNGAWSAASPFKGSQPVAAPTWIAGFRKLAAAIRTAVPDVKIVWNPAIGQHDPFPYYPGDDAVDLIGPDLYCQPAHFSSSTACWDDALQGSGGTNLDAFATFAAARRKPIVIPEWGDSFGDGVMIRRMRDWMDQNHVVAQSYWDSGDDLAKTAELPVLTVNQRAYVEAFGHRPYTGSYWHLIPVPAELRPH